MGLRNASVRLPNVVVMAPALTETAQPRNFKLSPNSDLSGLSLSSKKLRSLKDIVPLSLGDAKPDVCDNQYPDGMNGHSPSKITCTINGLSKSLKNEFVPIDKFQSLPTGPNDDPTETGDAGKKIANCSTGDCFVTQDSGFVMSNSGNSMGDNTDNMGIQRPNNNELAELTDPEAVSPNKKLSQGDVDQLLKNLVDKPEEIFGSADLGQNVDEILQVFNNIAGNSGTDLPPLVTTPSDGESMFPITSNDIAGSLTSLERELFNEVDMMNMCVDDSLVTMNKETMIKDRLEEARKKQFQLKRKCEFLGRRLKKMQTRTMGRHVCDEITGMIEYTNNMYEAVTRANKSAGDAAGQVTCDAKGVSLSTLSLLMRQMEHSAGQQASYLAKNAAGKSKYFGAGSSNGGATNGMRLPGTIIPSFAVDVKQEAAVVTGELQSQLSLLQAEIDSDLTESSSGCDSTDEFVPYNNPPLPYASSSQQLSSSVPLNKRALWRYSVERCLLAGRWAWLQARISDLDYRIRQTSELRRQLRLAKGVVRLRPPTPSLPTSASTTSPTSPAGETGGCARTLTMVEGLRRRRLVRTEGLHLRSKRAARAAGVRCGCRGPPPCLLCTGRPDPTAPVDPTQSLPVPARVALLDPAFHPHISFPSEVSESVHYAAVMKCGDWQSKAWRARGPTMGRTPTIPPVTSPIISIGAARDAVATLDDARRQQPRMPILGDEAVPTPNPSPASSSSGGFSQSTSSSKHGIRKKNMRGRKRRIPLEGFKVIKPRKLSAGVEDAGRSSAASTAVATLSSVCAPVVAAPVNDQDSVFNGGGSDKYASPVPSPTPSKDQFRRKRENSYDIDNIVIPYCMAASTRPERLHYKEILTPKWRLVKESDSVGGKNGAVRRPSHELEGEEDCSEEAVMERHERCEIEERKKFLSYTRINRPGGRGQRRTDSRTDSRADSTGPSTPLCMGEPMSPRESGNSMDSGEGASKSPRASPPPTSTQPTSFGTEGTLLGATTTRRRTTSGSSTVPNTPSNPRSPPPPPPPLQTEVAHYESRIFPLPDEVFEKMLQEQRESQEYPPDEDRPFRYSSEYGVLLDSSEEEV